MKILSFGAGMQSTALALMSCENAGAVCPKFPLVPVYDLVVFCDLGFEPPWVKEQMRFTQKACKKAGIPFRRLESPYTVISWRTSEKDGPSVFRGGRSGRTATNPKCQGIAPSTTRSR